MRNHAVCLLLFALAVLGLILAAFGVGTEDFNLAYLSLASGFAGLAAHHGTDR